MKYNQIPNADITVSEIGLGTMNFGDQLSRSVSHNLLDLATKHYGVNLIVSGQILYLHKVEE
jgi:aryl-alcohol dehydrogenase-like predicted oxidoreductase